MSVMTLKSKKITYPTWLEDETINLMADLRSEAAFQQLKNNRKTKTVNLYQNKCIKQKTKVIKALLTIR